MAAPRKPRTGSIKKKLVRSGAKGSAGPKGKRPWEAQPPRGQGTPARGQGKPPREGGPPGAGPLEGLPPRPARFAVVPDAIAKVPRVERVERPQERERHVERPQEKERRVERPQEKEQHAERPKERPKERPQDRLGHLTGRDAFSAERAEPRTPRTPRPPRPPGRRGPPSTIAIVEPLTLGAPGMTVSAFGRRFSISAGVPGDRLRVVLPRRADPRRAAERAEDDLPPARRLELVEAAPHRVQPPCAQLERCGACSLQELRYGQQVDAKTQALRALLAPLGAEVARHARVRPLSHPFAHRTRLLMAAGGLPGRLRFGFYERGAFGEPVPAEGCPVQHPLTLALLAMVTQVLDAANVAPTNSEDPRLGWLHGVAIRVDPARGRGELTLLGKTERLPRGPALATQLAALPGIDAVHLSVTPKRSSYPLGDVFVHLAGAKRTVFSLAGHSFPLSPGSYFQTCQEGAELLAALVLELLPARFRCLADLYAGVGVFTRLTTDRWERAIVAEFSPSAIADLEAAVANDPGRLQIKVLPGRVEQTIRRVLAMAPDVVLLDPPRRGCHRAVLEAIARTAPPTVVYVACGIDALLRDGLRLLAAGYRLDAAGAVDMFPHTPHLEGVARFVYDPPAT